VDLRKKRVIAAGPATAAAVVLLAAAALAASTAPVPARMVLRASDLPPGFIAVRDQTGPYTNSDAIRDKGRAKIRQWGRISGFRASYQQRDIANGSLPGVVAFAAEVSLYRTIRGAHASLVDPRFDCKRDEVVVPLAGHRPFAPDTLICTASELVSGARVRTFRMRWRNGRATGSVAVVTAEGAATAQTAWAAAVKQNRHMTAGLRS
jgi:hypothetical protein